METTESDVGYPEEQPPEVDDIADEVHRLAFDASQKAHKVSCLTTLAAQMRVGDEDGSIAQVHELVPLQRSSAPMVATAARCFSIDIYRSRCMSAGRSESL